MCAGPPMVSKPEGIDTAGNTLLTRQMPFVMLFAPFSGTFGGGLARASASLATPTQPF